MRHARYGLLEWFGNCREAEDVSGILPHPADAASCNAASPVIQNSVSRFDRPAQLINVAHPDPIHDRHNLIDPGSKTFSNFNNPTIPSTWLGRIV